MTDNSTQKETDPRFVPSSQGSFYNQSVSDINSAFQNPKELPIWETPGQRDPKSEFAHTLVRNLVGQVGLGFVLIFFANKNHGFAEGL